MGLALKLHVSSNVSRSRAAGIDKHFCVLTYRNHSYPWPFFWGGGGPKSILFSLFKNNKASFKYINTLYGIDIRVFFNKVWTKGPLSLSYKTIGPRLSPIMHTKSIYIYMYIYIYDWLINYSAFYAAKAM